MGLLSINLLIDLSKQNFPSDMRTHIAEVNAVSSLHHLTKWIIVILIVYWLNLVYHLIKTKYVQILGNSYFQSLLGM